MKPFEVQSAEKNLMIQVSEISHIPKDMFADWKLYEEILFHLVQNSIKFNRPGGSILIDISFYPVRIP